MTDLLIIVRYFSGRDRELKILTDELKMIHQTPEIGCQRRQMLIIEGDPGIGKTRVLDSTILIAMQMDIK